jgi:hypothetical protein
MEQGLKCSVELGQTTKGPSWSCLTDFDQVLAEMVE